MARRVDQAKAKEKRQKIIAAVGGVLLLAILAFQVPRTMKMLNAKPPPPPPASSVPSSADPSVLPTPATATGTPATSGPSAALVDSDVPPSAVAGQLIAFGRFASKDPFIQQIGEETVAGAAAPQSGAKAPQSGAKAPQSSNGVVPGSSTGEPAPATPSGAALISINGAEEVVAVGSEFPKDEPVFKLVSIKAGEVRIGIAGGKLASGKGTVTLKRGKPVTLVNTADGARYELTLISTG